MCFCTAAFDKDTLSVLFYIRRKVILSSVQRYDYFVCRVNRVRVMLDFVKDPNRFQIL